MQDTQSSIDLEQNGHHDAASAAKEILVDEDDYLYASKEEEDDNNDEFGDFGEATTDIPDKLEEEEDFGDFGDDMQSAEILENIIESEQQREVDLNDKIIPDSEETTQQANIDVSLSSEQDLESDSKIPADDDVNHATDGMPSHQVIDDDEFDDFVSPVASTVPQTLTNDDDGEFGDYDCAEPEQSTEMANVQMEQTSSNPVVETASSIINEKAEESERAKVHEDDDNDDFGDFGAAELTNPVESDDFGDFDEANFESEAKENISSESFGKFEQVDPSPAVPAGNQTVDMSDDFGDFAAFGESDDIGSTSVQPQMPSIANEPAIQRAKIVFSRVFPISREVSSPPNDTAAREESHSIASIIVCIHSIVFPFQYLTFLTLIKLYRNHCKLLISLQPTKLTSTLTRSF
jgi:hypothetical protein